MNPANSDVLRSALHDLGLNEAEVSVYQASLFLGPKPASLIAKSSGVNRAHIYRVLETLKERGFVEEYVKNNIKSFLAIAPEVVLDKLDSLVAKISQRRRSLENILPKLERVKSRSSGHPIIRFLQGSSGLERALEDTLSTPDGEIAVFTDASTGILSGVHVSERWIKSYTSRRLAQHIQLRLLIGTAHALAVLPSVPILKQECRVILGTHFPADIFVYGDKIAVLSSKSEQRGVILENRAMAESFRALHNLLWNRSDDTVQEEHEEEASYK